MNIFKTIEESYDKMGETYHNFRDNEKFNNELEKFANLLPVSGNVLDAGCGVGIPVSKFLVRRGFKVTGIDISKKMIDLAKQNVPEATFYQKNILTLDLPGNSFDGIICVYTLWHIPRAEHSFIISNFHRMIKEKGLLVINTGVFESERMSEFFGEPMLWSNNNPKKTLNYVIDAGFSIIFEGVLKRGEEMQYWIFAKKENKE